MTLLYIIFLIFKGPWGGTSIKMITGTVVIEVAKHLLHATSQPSKKGTPDNPETISLIFFTGAGLDKDSHGRRDEYRDDLCLTREQTNKQEESRTTFVLPSSGGNELEAFNNDNWTTSVFSTSNLGSFRF